MPKVAPLVVFPPPPDTARIQFLTRFAGAADFRGGRSFLDIVAGSREDRSRAIQKPYGVAIDRGKIYVCDTRLAGVDIIDLEERSFEQFVPRGEGRLQTPASCALDPTNRRLYVADVARGQVVVFDSTLNYITAFGQGPGVEPADVFVGVDRVWVSDIGTARVRVYDKHSLQLVQQFPEADPGSPDALRQPTHIYVSGEQVYVSDGLQFMVKIYDMDGNLVKTVGMVGRGPGQFARPKGIAVDRDGVLYVVDAAFENVQMFDRDGRLLTFFGGPYEGPGYLYLPVKVIVDYENRQYFEQYVDPRFALKHLILVTNQFGPDKVTVYGFVELKGETSDAR